MKRYLGLVLISVALLTTGCKLDPATARDAVVTADGFLDDIQVRYISTCAPAPQLAVCLRINQGVVAQRLAAQTLNTWCAGPPLPGEKPYNEGGNCSEVPGIEPRMQEVLNNLNVIMNDVKKIGGR